MTITAVSGSMTAGAGPICLLAAWSTNPGGPPDFDADGTVAVTDLLQLLAHWGPCPPA